VIAARQPRIAPPPSRRPNPAISAKPAEPEIVGWQVSPVAGEPISATDTAIVAPVAPANPQWIAFAEDEREWVGYEPAAAPIDIGSPPATHHRCPPSGRHERRRGARWRQR